MNRVSVTDLANHLSEYLRRVKRGETLEVHGHSVPIARIQPIPQRTLPAEERLAGLVRSGIARPPLVPLDLSFLDRPPLPCSADAARAVIENR